MYHTTNTLTSINDLRDAVSVLNKGLHLFTIPQNKAWFKIQVAVDGKGWAEVWRADKVLPNGKSTELDLLLMNHIVNSKGGH